jgi:hypothetical protein
MGFKVPQHWGILGAKISIHDRAKYNKQVRDWFKQAVAQNWQGIEYSYHEKTEKGHYRMML